MYVCTYVRIGTKSKSKRRCYNKVKRSGATFMPNIQNFVIHGAPPFCEQAAWTPTPTPTPTMRACFACCTRAAAAVCWPTRRCCCRCPLRHHHHCPQPHSHSLSSLASHSNAATVAAAVAAAFHLRTYKQYSHCARQAVVSQRNPVKVKQFDAVAVSRRFNALSFPACVSFQCTKPLLCHICKSFIEHKKIKSTKTKLPA